MAKPKGETEGLRDAVGIPMERWDDETAGLTEEDRRRKWGEETCARRDRWADQLRADTRKRLGTV